MIESESEDDGTSDALASLNDRRREIIDRAKIDGFVTVERLSDLLKVSPQTIRRDITALCDAGLLRRYHGGASLVSNSRNSQYTQRQSTVREGKAAIAKAVAYRIPDGSSVFIDIGTTAAAVAQELLETKRDLRIVTTSLNVAMMMAAGKDFEVTIVGGQVRLADLGVFGESAVDMLGQYKVDFGVIGISGIDSDGTLLDFDHREVRIARVAMANSRTTYLVADHTKFGRAAMVKVAPLSAVDVLFVDRMPGGAYDEMIRASGVIVQVGDETAEAPPRRTDG
jgi:DeoR family glycerol-3-phosphate regulon repressor